MLTITQATPEKYTNYDLAPIDEFFAMGRGLQKPEKDGHAAIDVPSLVCIYLQTNPWIQLLMG